MPTKIVSSPSVTFCLERNETHFIAYTEADISIAWLSRAEHGAIRRAAAMSITGYRLQHQAAPSLVRSGSTLQPPTQQLSPWNQNVNVYMRGLEHHSTAGQNKAKNLQGSTIRRAILAVSSNEEKALLSARLTAADVKYAIKVASADATIAKIIQAEPIDSTAEADIRPRKMLYKNLHDHGNDKLGPAQPHRQGLVYNSLFSRRRRAPGVSTSRMLPLPAALPQMSLHHQEPPNLASVLGEALGMKLQCPSLHGDH